MNKALISLVLMVASTPMANASSPHECELRRGQIPGDLYRYEQFLELIEPRNRSLDEDFDGVELKTLKELSRTEVELATAIRAAIAAAEDANYALTLCARRPG